MKKQIRFLTLLAALALVAAPAHAQISAGNVRAAQRSGTKLVDIDYDISGTTNPVFVALEISADGGTTWAVPANTLTGAVGTNVTPGANLRITWDAGTDWNNQTSNQTRFQINVSESMAGQADFAIIPAGSFTMGDSLDGMADAPPHTVSVSTFCMQKMEVTKAEWDAVRSWGLLHGYTDLPSGGSGGYPMDVVSWYNVVKWCNARSEKEGLTPCYYTDAEQTLAYRTGSLDIENTMVKWNTNGYRLPTEAEWEKAARGGLNGKRFPNGDSITVSDANYNYDIGSPTTVGLYAPNGYELYDMAGNAWELCWDRYSDSFYYAPEGLTNPTGPTSGSDRVMRGGCWNNSPYFLSAAFRHHISKDYTDIGIGFRTVRANIVTADSPNIAVDTNNPILTIIASHGTVPGAGQYPLNTTVELTATPDTGYLFSKWTGDATGNANPLTLLMDVNKTINAIFVPDSRDPDNDNLTNYQEIVVYGSNPALWDTDEDGFNDGYEVNSGYSPTSATSTPETSLVIYTAVEIRFGAALGQNYRVESSTDLQTWTTVEEHIAGTGGTVARLYSIQEIPKRYFRSVRE